MWKNKTWATGRYDCRLDWSRNGVKPFLSVLDASFVRVVAVADKIVIRKSKSVSISRLKGVAVRSSCAAKPGLKPRSFCESRASQPFHYPV